MKGLCTLPEFVQLAFIKEIHPEDLNKILNKLHDENQKMLGALEYFCGRVEDGTIRSITTYNMYKKIIEEVKQK